MRRALTVAATVCVGLAGFAVPVTAAPPPGQVGDLPGQPARVLQPGSAGQADLLPEHLDRLVADVEAGTRPQASGRPFYAGATVLAARHGVVARQAATGWARRWADDTPTPLPSEQWLPMREDTIFDLASVSKLFTSIAAIQQVEQGRLDLDVTVASYLPAFAANGKDRVTVRQLLTHTSGLPAWLPLWSRYDSSEARIAAVYAATPFAAPGTAYRYSDLNMITLGKLVELVSGATLDVAVRDGITAPLGMADTGYNPPAAVRHRVTATEYQGYAGRGLVWGEVHDENAWSLGGVAGHAGVFSTAWDLAVLGQTILNGGSYGDVRILSRESTAMLLRNENSAFPGNDHGLGFELYQHWYMGAMATPYTAGHTGFTGTMLVLDPTTDSLLVLLTNRVHPSRAWGSINPVRRAVANDLARAVPVRPARGRAAWFSGMGDARTATLTVPLTLPAPTAEGGPPAWLSFALWYDTERADDVATLELSTDEGTTWSAVPFSVHDRGGSWQSDGTVSGWGGRRWLAARAPLPAVTGDVLLRWRYTTDALYHGRGVYVDGVLVIGPDGLVFDDSRPADAARFVADGFIPSPD